MFTTFLTSMHRRFAKWRYLFFFIIAAFFYSIFQNSSMLSENQSLSYYSNKIGRIRKNSNYFPKEQGLDQNGGSDVQTDKIRTVRNQILIVTKEISLQSIRLDPENNDNNDQSQKTTRPIVDQPKNLKTMLRIFDSLRWKYYLHSTAVSHFSSKFSGFPPLWEKNNNLKGRYAFIIIDSLEALDSLSARNLAALSQYRKVFEVGIMVFGYSELDFNDQRNSVFPTSNIASNISSISNNQNSNLADNDQNLAQKLAKLLDLNENIGIKMRLNQKLSTDGLKISSEDSFNQILKSGSFIPTSVSRSAPFYSENEKYRFKKEIREENEIMKGQNYTVVRIGYQPYEIMGFGCLMFMFILFFT